MTEEQESRSVPGWIKLLLALGLVAFLYIQSITLLGPEGILSRYTVLEGFSRFDDLMLADPLTTAGLIDLVALMLGFGIILVEGLPRGRWYPLLALVFVAILLVYPGLAVLLFLLFFWKRRRQFEAH